MMPLYTLFGVTLSSYYSMMLLGFVFMLILMLIEKKHYGLKSGQAVLFTVCVMIAGVLGCMILYFIEHLPNSLRGGLWFGFSFFGAELLVPLFTLGFGLLFKMKPERSTSAAAICVCAMIGTIRIGCFLHGCCGGKVTAAGFQWPTQLMESVGDYLFLIFLLKWSREGKKGLYPRFMIMYGSLRFIIEFFRESSTGKVLDEGHLLALLSIVIGLSFTLAMREHKRVHR